MSIGAEPAERGAALKPLLIDAAGVAGLLSVTRVTVHRWDRAGLLPSAIRIGGAVRWHRGELEAWAAAGCPARGEWLRQLGGGA